MMRADIESVGNPAHDPDRWIPDASFDPADIGSVQASVVRQFVLGPAFPASFRPDVLTKQLPDVHLERISDVDKKSMDYESHA